MKVYHIKKADGASIGQTLNDFTHDYGAPDHLTFDGAAVHTGSATDFYNALKRN